MRAFVAVLSLCLLPVHAAVDRADINFEFVRKLALERSRAPYKAPPADLSPRLAALSYDEFRKIEFRGERSLWREDNLPFQIQFFPRGGLFRDPVVLREFSSTHVQTIPFAADYFETGGIPDFPALPRRLGYAGFRLLFPLNRADAHNEVAAFLGASYFRAIGADQHYGLSARGLALDSGVRGREEEFPRFSEFWLGKPSDGAIALTLYALLEGPSVTGAYEFLITPGRFTVTDVRSVLIFRSTAKLAGHAPLTSMFWFGENSERPRGEMRPEVHDSDGLLVQQEDGTQIWRPLRNPQRVVTTDLPIHRLKRFGLFQRDRAVSNYLDPVAQYERRPTAWIEPREEWKDGTLRLIEIPTIDEYQDNIVAYWVPASRPEPNQPVEMRYRVVWAQDEPAESDLARVSGTREGDRPEKAKGRLFWVDFSDEKLAERPAIAIKPEIEVGGGARVIHSDVFPYPEIGSWRVTFAIEADESGGPVELRCRLRDNDRPISETWSYTWIP